MTKIETYTAKKAIAERLARDAHLSFGLGPHNDKHRAKAEFVDIDEGSQWLQMMIGIKVSPGNYGSSGTYSAMAEDMGQYLAKAITEQMPALLDAAVALARADAETARQDAEAEARAVLEDSAT